MKDDQKGNNFRLDLLTEGFRRWLTCRHLKRREERGEDEEGVQTRLVKARVEDAGEDARRRKTILMCKVRRRSREERAENGTGRRRRRRHTLRNHTTANSGTENRELPGHKMTTQRRMKKNARSAKRTLSLTYQRVQ